MSKQQKRSLINISNRGIRVLIAFILGQCVQIVCHAVAINLWSYRQIPFCASAGFLVVVAVFAGMRIAVKEGKEEMQDADNRWY